MDGTPWKGSSWGLLQKTEIFFIKAPVATPGGKILDGRAILHKAWIVTGKAACKNTHKHMESFDPPISRDNFPRLTNGLESLRGGRAITSINGKLIPGVGKLVGQKQAKVDKFIVPDFGLKL